MKKLKKQELVLVAGGINLRTLTGTLINAFVKAGKYIYELGRSFGSSVRRINEKNLCPLN